MKPRKLACHKGWRASVVSVAVLGLLGCIPSGLNVPPIDLSFLSAGPGSSGLGTVGITGTGGGVLGGAGGAVGATISIAVAEFGEPSKFEQFMLELINRARMNPNAEARRLGLPAADDGARGQISVLPVQPLAMSARLLETARTHTNAMISQQFFSRVDPDNRNEFNRISERFPFVLAAENIGLEPGDNLTSNTLVIHNDLFVDEGVLGRRDRKNILDPGLKQIGIGINTGIATFDVLQTAGTFATEDFATSSINIGSVFVTGVAFNDVNGNGVYDPDEGSGAVLVTLGNADVGTVSVLTAQNGGYAFQVFVPAVYTITFADNQALSGLVDVRDKNIKVDLAGSSLFFYDPNNTF